MTKRIFTYIISMVCITIILLLLSFMSYRIALYRFNSQSVERGNSQFYSIDDSRGVADYTEDSISITDSVLNNLIEPDSILVDSITDLTVSIKTTFKLQTYDLMTKEMSEESLKPPDYLIGLTREEVISYLHEYMSDLKLSEFEKGLMNYELISFSVDEIVLRKSYNSGKVEYKYYLAVIDGMLTVYYSDLSTVFEYTDILVSDLSAEEQLELMNGKFVKDIEELYGILENYSS